MFDQPYPVHDGTDAAWFVYLFALTDCSAFKVGFSTNPLQRIHTFSRRYFERFDLHQSLLLRLDTCAAARAVEAQLKSELASFRMAAPAWVPSSAGGHTEWFSAIYFTQAETTLRAAVPETAQLLNAFEVLQAHLALLTADFEVWAWRLAQQVCDGHASQSASANTLRDWLDTYRYFDIRLFTDDPAVHQFMRAIQG